MSKKPRKKGSYTVLGLGAGTGIGVAIGVALYSSGGRWGDFDWYRTLCWNWRDFGYNLGCTSQEILEGTLNKVFFN